MPTTAEIDAIIKNTPAGHLGPSELFWRDHYNWLKECGYVLRPRYAPDWVPSWEAKDPKNSGPRKPYHHCEDGQMSPVRTHCYLTPNP